jgi:hypothetical protein
VHVWVGQNLYALGECDSNAVRLTAREQLTRDGLAESFITEAAVTRRAEALVVRCVIEQGQTVERSALARPSSPEVRAVRAGAARDRRHAELAARGVDMKARIAHAVAESEAPEAAAMTMPQLALTPTDDPTGLHGDRITLNQSNPPHVVEMWAYPSSLSFADIKAAWYAAPRRGRSVIMGISEYRVSAGRRFVTLNLYVEPKPAPVHLDEPNV